MFPQTVSESVIGASAHDSTVMYLFWHPDYCTTCLDPELVEDLEDKEAGVVIPEN